jgi:aminoglycoside 6'-N-acetyltransferase
LRLRGERVVLRPATEDDLPRFAEILRAPEVAPWWVMDHTPEALRDEILRADVTTFAIEVNGEAAGLVQYHEETTPGFRSAGIDIAIAPEHQNQGLGTDAVRTMARYLLDERGHHRLTIDPAAANERAIASYRKVGFRTVGVMRQYERDADGVWRDGLLMDLLRGELT